MKILWCEELTKVNFKKAVTSIIAQNRPVVKTFFQIHRIYTNKKTEQMFGLRGRGSGYTPVLTSPANAAISRPLYAPAPRYCPGVSTSA